MDDRTEALTIRMANGEIVEIPPPDESDGWVRVEQYEHGDRYLMMHRPRPGLGVQHSNGRVVIEEYAGRIMAEGARILRHAVYRRGVAPTAPEADAPPTNPFPLLNGEDTREEFERERAESDQSKAGDELVPFTQKDIADAVLNANRYWRNTGVDDGNIADRVDVAPPQHESLYAGPRNVFYIAVQFAHNAIIKHYPVFKRDRKLPRNDSGSIRVRSGEDLVYIHEPHRRAS